MITEKFSNNFIAEVKALKTAAERLLADKNKGKRSYLHRCKVCCLYSKEQKLCSKEQKVVNQWITFEDKLFRDVSIFKLTSAFYMHIHVDV